MNTPISGRAIPLTRTVILIAIAIAIVGVFAVLAIIPPAAHAVTAAEKRAEADEVYTQIDSLQTSLNEAMWEYDNATAAHEEAIERRDEAARQIKEETERIDKLQSELSSFAVGVYKQGGTESYLDVLLQTSSFDDFVTSWDVVSDISKQGKTLLEAARQAREQLETSKAEYEEQSVRAEQEMNTAENKMAQIQVTQEALRAEASRLSAEADELQMQEELAAEAARQAEEARKQQEEALAAAAASGSADGGSGASAGASVLMGSGYFTNPCPAASNSSGFGYRSFDNSFHKGTDMAAPEGTPYYAADSGTVMYATNGGGYNGGAGNWVVISHGNGIVTKYMHSQVTFVSPGDYVQRGQNIGLVGNTGQSFGAHLHFQVEVDGVAVNPNNYI